MSFPKWHSEQETPSELERSDEVLAEAFREASCERVLELGTYCGYSAIVTLASALKALRNRKL